MPFFEASDGTRLFYAEAGRTDDRPFVFAHAWGLASGMWNYQIPDLLAAGMRCVVFDRRGHGRSDVPGRGYDLDRLADDLADLLDHLDLRDIVLVGHSLGAAEAVRYLSRHQDGRVAGVVLSAPTTPFLLRTDDNPDGPVEASDFAGLQEVMRRDIGVFVEGTSHDDYFGPAYEVSGGLGDWTRRQFFESPLQVLLSTNEAFITADQRQELKNIQQPALVIQGDADRSAPIELTGRRTHALLPHASLAVLQDAGHGLYMSDPGRYNAELLHFADTLPAKATPWPYSLSR
ncbi:alpha/beta fold hydrolase [Actinomadura verrucosospora]|uniref:Arylesterase (Aryl-ester hydrolase) n=1 Tax=Actinomadura verrucosospora TaxID=46165 RepID=A0A7D3VXQ3_ACTVE|nr:alpha/beta hydrolase [Actinomadura verrucosospora]QKG23494.1 arylesterase (Aryl-ester hydrolase) [Actinomadura verrucosospora]